mgnify:CR=1 FL=1
MQRLEEGYEIKYMLKDNSPEILLPSNGGYNPKMKSIFVPPEKTAKAQPPEIPTQIPISASHDLRKLTSTN